jgi:hypothetical protein
MGFCEDTTSTLQNWKLTNVHMGQIYRAERINERIIAENRRWSVELISHLPRSELLKMQKLDDRVNMTIQSMVR